MAVTGIWKIDSRLDHVIDYITNIEKTLNTNCSKESYTKIHNFKEYQEYDFSTEKQLFVSGINCTPKIAYQEMIITKKQFNKTNGIIGFHAFQSFKEKEVSPEIAHRIGIELAQEMWGDRFEVIVSTHINTNHIHNHFVINSVSFKDGKKYYDNHSTYAELRHLSDNLCQEYGLSVLEEKTCRRSKINYDNYYNATIKKSNYHTMAKEDLDKAIGQAYSYNDFENIMKVMGYQLYYRYNKLTIKRNPYKKSIRVERAFGEEYSTDKIKERIQNTHETRVPFPEAYHKKYKFFSKYNRYSKQKYHGIYGLYLHYLYLLKKYTIKKQVNYLTPAMRMDIQKMDNISKEARLLVRKNLETYEQFFSYKENISNQLEKLLGKRDNLWYQYRKSKYNDEKTEIRENIDILSTKIKKIREEVGLLKSIETRIPELETRVKEYVEDNMNGKEVEKYEFIK